MGVGSFLVTVFGQNISAAAGGKMMSMDVAIVAYGWFSCDSFWSEY